MEDRVLVLGAGFAGVNAALKLDRRGFDVEVIDQNSYHEHTPGIIELYRERVPEEKIKMSLPEFFSGTDIHFCREIVEEVRPRENKVKTNAGIHEYRYLVLALGGEPRTFDIDISGAETPYSLRDVKQIKRKLDEDDVEEIIMVGSGYVGVETAAEISLKGHDVTVIDQSTRPMPASNEKAAHIGLNYMNAKDINFRGGQKVIEVGEDYVKCKDGKRIEGDLVLWAGGIQANEVVRESFGTDESGLPVDENLQCNKFPNVFAIGDCAYCDSLKTAHKAWMQARVASGNIGKPKERMDEFTDRAYPLMVGLGNTGAMVFGKRAIKGRIFRYMKGLIRRGFFLQLKISKHLGRSLKD